MAFTCGLDCDQELDIVFRGTTPTFNFSVCLDTTLVDLQNTHIVFTSGPTIVDKTGDDIILNDKILSCTLTQDDTMSFKGSQVNIQILVTMTSGQKPASSIMTIPISSTLKGGKIW